MKNIVVLKIISITLFFTLQLKAQTFLGATIGRDFSQIHEKPNDILFEVYDRGYSSRSWFYGLKVEQKLSKDLGLSIQGIYTKKEVDALIYNFAPMKGFEFSLFRTTISLNKTFLNNFSVGLGPSYSLLYNINQVTQNGGLRAPLMNDKREIGGAFIVGIKYWNLLLELNYNIPLVPSGGEDEEYSIKPIKSFGISINYMLRVIGSNRGSKIYCPRKKKIK